MNTDFDTVSDWFVLKAGFKVHGRCPHCHSSNLAYYKTRRPGLTGISANSKGITPFCLDCEKNLPEQLGGKNHRSSTKKQLPLHAD